MRALLSGVIGRAARRRPSLHGFIERAGATSVILDASRSRESSGSMGNRLYVGNLSFSTTQAAIESAFASAGEVREVAMPTDRETGQFRGFAFVTMGSAQAANAAIAQLNGMMLDGRSIKVNEAQERPPRGGGGGGGGYGGGGGGGRGGRDRY